MGDCDVTGGGRCNGDVGGSGGGFKSCLDCGGCWGSCGGSCGNRFLLLGSRAVVEVVVGVVALMSVLL